MSENESIFSKFSGKTGFFAGIGTMIVLFFVVGFVVLLVITLKNNGQNNKAVVDANKAGNVAGANQEAEPENAPIKEVKDDEWIRGNKNAKITMVQFSDLECPFCKTFHATMQQLFKEYGNDIRWVFRQFPLSQLHPKAVKEAEAAECAGEQGGNDNFWKYIDKVFAVTPSNNGLDPAQLPKIATEIGLDVKKFTECLDSGKYSNKIQASVSDAAAAGVRGTPYTVILVDGQETPINGAVPYEQLKSFVDSVLKK